MKTSEINVDFVGHYGTDLSVVDAARVSFNKTSEFYKQLNEETGEEEFMLSPRNVRLIYYLAKHKHLSPFNHAFLSFRVKAPLFIARQLVKHKFLPWNEVSRRYVDEEPEFYLPDIWRAKADNVKQGSSDQEVENGEHINSGLESLHMALHEYQGLIEMGVAPEQARMILPQNMMTEWIWSGTLGAFLDMLVLRLDPHTQYESRIVAQKIAEYVKQLFPVSYQARVETIMKESNHTSPNS